jgi:hypothetical protein
LVEQQLVELELVELELEQLELEQRLGRGLGGARDGHACG